MARLGRTYGRPNTPWGTKVYFKPAMGRVIARKPGVVRRSEKVLSINEQLENLAGKPDHPATQCKGKPWREFVSCLRAKMKEKITKVRT